MNEFLTNTLTITFEDEAGDRHSQTVCATIEVIGDDARPSPVYLENIARSH